MVPSDEPALAEMGGSVLGTYLPGNMELAEENGRKVLRFRDPGSGALTFPLTGNLTHAEGTLLMDIAYDFDPAEVHAAVPESREVEPAVLPVPGRQGRKRRRTVPGYHQ